MMNKSESIIEIIERLFPYRFLLARITKIPILGGFLENFAFGEEDELIYLPQNKVVSVDEYVEPPESMALPSQVVEHFIKEADFRWKMDFCICRRSNQCDDYPIDLGCLFLGEAAKDISPEHGESVSEEEALEHLEECREAGLVHMIGRNKLDHVWLDVGKEGKLLTICNCCPCCCISNMAPVASSTVRDKYQKMPGVKVEVTNDCVGCGTCTEMCYMNAINIEENQATIGEECIGCGQCAHNCPNDAIKLTIEDPEFLEKSIKSLENKVDVS